MTPRERITAVLEGRAPDKVPINHVSVSSHVASRILGREACVGGSINQWRESVSLWNGPDAHAEFVERTRQDAIDIAIAMDQDVVRPSYWRSGWKPAARIDEHTFRYESDDGARWEVKRLDPVTELYNTVDGAQIPEPVLADLDEIVAEREADAEQYVATEDMFADFAYAFDKVGAEREVRAPGVCSAIPVSSRAWLEATIQKPRLVRRYLNTQVSRSLKNLAVLARMGARILFGGGDFASNQGPMYSPATFHDIMLPCLVTITEACHMLGLYHFFGSDGNVWPVADDLYGRSGIDGHYEVDRRAGMNCLAIHERYPQLTMLGGISSFTLHTGTPQQVEAETRECLEEAKQTNKVIIGCSNIIMPGTSAENVAIMRDTIAKYR